ncbi:AAA family ATPase [Natronorubrum tibetense]|uniref:AAA+ ATPase domain-containing protein n=1 Tax=Natronorubrum tibetense GA33 TaxID=1114856 RepID=L9VS39_9EURY|nr:AAA family ATPase [Natronorubrum tibetense]ELY39876.1 hypothetical protein C496_14401 [Natronorubrum tibetense GA33]
MELDDGTVITRTDVIEGFKNTKDEPPYESHSKRVYVDGKGKGVKDVFRNLPGISDDANLHTHRIEDLFETLGFETGTDDGSTDLSITGDIGQVWHFGFNDGWWELFKENKCVSIGFSGANTDLSELTDVDAIVSNSGLEDDSNHPRNPAEQLRKFAHDVQIGDILVIKDGQRFEDGDSWAGGAEIPAIGVVTGEYQYSQAEDWYNSLPAEIAATENHHHRRVDWVIDLESSEEGRFQPNALIQQWTIDDIDYENIKRQLLDARGFEAEFEELEQRSAALVERRSEQIDSRRFDDVIEFGGIDALIDRFVDVWRAGGYEEDAESPVGWETWKWDYQKHLQEEFLSNHEITNLSPDDVEELTEVLDEKVSLNTRVPVYMLGGGANGGIAWRDFKEISREDPGEAAKTLSFFFDTTEDIEERLEAFREFYSEIDTGPGSLLALAACLLMFVHPAQYIHYKWTQMREFFAEFSEYTVSQGFDSDQYRELNQACERLRERLEGRVEEPSMLHVQSMIWSWGDLMSETDVKAEEFREAAPDDVAFYWVNQTHTEELEKEYLRSQDTKWQRDLTVLEPGDVVFHYTDQALQAVSTVVNKPYRDEYEGGQQYFVELSTEWFDTPVPRDTVTEVLQKPEIRQEQSRYPIDKNGGVIQAYLCHLTPAAGAFLLDVADASIPDRGERRDDGEKRYFWVNAANTGWHEEGGEAFYALESSDGTERRNQEAYEQARSGDEGLVYRVSTAKQVIGRVRVVEGLHEEVPEGRDETAEGITFQWEESLDGAQWCDVMSDPELTDSKLVTSDNSYYITELDKREYNRILELGEITRFEKYEEELTVPASEITVEQGNLHFQRREWERLQSRIEKALMNGNHVLLFGPPGTGKTKLARQICEATVGAKNYELVTASADWSTFDTVGGYQTTTQNTLEFEPGVVLDRFQRNEDGMPANEWLVIDELNRADIDKAFGSMFSALTGESVTLPFDGSDGSPIQILDASRSHEEVKANRFYIPEDWRMLATINTLDKTSLYEMSYAFMRRWAFVPVGIPNLPDREDGDDSELESLVADYVAVWAANGEVPEADHHYETVGRIWRAVNEQRAIGPAIVEDIYEHVAAASSMETADYVSPIIMYVFPQLEGLRRNELEQLIGALEVIVDDETGELWTVARDFFQVDLQPGGGE